MIIKLIIFLFTIVFVFSENYNYSTDKKNDHLLNILLSFNKNSPSEQPTLWEIHGPWIEQLYHFILETAVQGDKVMQDFELESLTIGGEHSQKVKAPPIVRDYGSKSCITLSPSTAVSRFIKSVQYHHIVYPKDQNHPIFFIDRKDAKEFIKPILKNIYNFDLTDEIINCLFFEKITIKKDDSEQSNIALFREERFKKETFRIALKTSELIQGHILFILGQTPAYLGEMIRTIDEQNNSLSQIIQIPFSGRPDYSNKPIYKVQRTNAFLDIITEESKDTFYQMIEKKHFSPKKWQDGQKKIYILDISAGASISCFLSLLKSWFEKENIQIPEIIFLELLDKKAFEDQQVGEFFDFPILNFNELTYFNIPVIFLNMQRDILIEFDRISDHLRVVPPFNGIYWSKEYLQPFFNQYPTAQARELLQEYRTYALINGSSTSVKFTSSNNLEQPL